MHKTLELYKSSIPYQNPQWIKKGFFHSREALFMMDHEKDFIIEFSPLPHFSKESLEQVEKEIKSHLHLFLTLSVEEFFFMEKKEFSSSFLFGLLSYLLKKKQTLSQGYKTRSFIESSFDTSNLTESISKRIDFLIQKKSSVIKVKLSSYTISEIENLLSSLDDKTKKHLHLDFNQMLSFDEAIKLFSSTCMKDYFLIEEPLKNPNELFELEDQFTFSLALDESLREDSHLQLLQLKSLKSLELKPQIDLHRLFDPFLLKKEGLITQLSSSFETPNGLEQVALIASNFFKDPLLGIDTFSVFDENAFLSFPYKKDERVYFNNTRPKDEFLKKLC